MRARKIRRKKRNKLPLKNKRKSLKKRKRLSDKMRFCTDNMELA